MTLRRSHRSFTSQRFVPLFAMLFAIMSAPTALAGGAAFPVLDIDFNIDSMSFGGTADMPLGTGFTPVTTDILFTARPGGGGNLQANGPNQTIQNGDQLFFENTTMSVTFDITLTDTDQARNFAGGASFLTLSNLMLGFDDVVFVPNCTADTSQFYAGCGMVLNNNFSEGDTTTLMEGDYDLVTASLPISFGQDADGLNGIDQLSATFLELAFSGPISEVLNGQTVTQGYEVDVLWSGSINPDFGPIALSGSATTFAPVPEPSAALLIGAGLAMLISRRRTTA